MNNISNIDVNFYGCFVWMELKTLNSIEKYWIQFIVLDYELTFTDNLTSKYFKATKSGDNLVLPLLC